jgi:hypothetical protein
MLAKIILAVTMAASALLGGGGPFQQEQAASIDGYYLFVDDFGQPSIWQETNGQPGLQTVPSTLHGGLFRIEVPPDNRVLL